MLREKKVYFNFSCVVMKKKEPVVISSRRIGASGVWFVECIIYYASSSVQHTYKKEDEIKIRRTNIRIR